MENINLFFGWKFFDYIIAPKENAIPKLYKNIYSLIALGVITHDISNLADMFIQNINNNNEYYIYMYDQISIGNKFLFLNDIEENNTI